MVTFGLSYDVKPEHQEEFVRVTRDVLKSMQDAKGHRVTRLYQDVDKPTSYMIYSDWATREDFMAFIHSDAFKQVQVLGREMLVGPPAHNIYTKGEMGGPPRA